MTPPSQNLKLSLFHQNGAAKLPRGLHEEINIKERIWGARGILSQGLVNTEAYVNEKIVKYYFALMKDL